MYALRPDKGAGLSGTCPRRQLIRSTKTSLEYSEIGASKLRFARATYFLRKLSEVWSRTFEKVRQPSPRQEKFKEYRFEGAPNY